MQKYILFTLLFIFTLHGLSQENECEINIPSAISITSDSDRFSVGEDCHFEEFSFKLYNRWGQLLFEAKNTEEFTNFNPNEKVEVKGEKDVQYRFKPGVYVFILEARKVGEKEANTITRSITFL